jgi:serine/threonine-protein kinase
MSNQPPADHTGTYVPPEQTDAPPPEEGPAAALPVGESVLEALAAGLPELPRVQLRQPAEDTLTGADLPPAPAATAPADGRPPGRYRLQGEIARGGMGVVLKGVDTDLGRDIAVKVLLQAHAGKTELLQRFVEEAQIAGQLQHPGIVPVYELGQFRDKGPYFTMKLVKGQTLARLLAARRGPAEDLPRFVAVFEQVCQTLAYAHARGVIHRDLKPGNVMVGAFGEVQVMDWGLAKVLPRGPDAQEQIAPQEELSVIQTKRSIGSTTGGEQTQAGSVLGTPAYMAPEQARGEVELVDERADVFGLGAILCQVLTGLPPFAGGAEVMQRAQRANLAEAFARLDGWGADAELIALARRCLAAEPGGRPRNAGEVAEAVTAYQRSVAERLHRAEVERAQAQVKAAEERKRHLLATGLVLALVVGAGGAISWYQRDQARRAAEQVQRRYAAEKEVEGALRKAGDLRDRALGLTLTGNRRTEVDAMGARTELARAEDLLEQEAGLDERLRRQVRRMAEVLDADAQDRRLLARFEQARRDEAEVDVARSQYKTSRTYPALTAALAEYGLPVGRMPSADAAQRIARCPTAVQAKLVALLDRCLQRAVRKAAQEREWRREVLAWVDRDPWRGRVRAALASADRKALIRLAQEVDVRRQGPDFLLLLAEVLQDERAPLRIDLLRRAQQQHPGDFWVNHALAYSLEGSVFERAQRRPVTAAERTALNEAVRYYTAAAALRPANPGVYVNLSSALRSAGDLDGAARAARKAIRLAPTYVGAYANLGLALFHKKDFTGAVAVYRKALALPGKTAERDRRTAAIIHSNLGLALRGKKDLQAALAAFRKAIELHPKSAGAHNNLGITLTDLNDVKGAVAAYRQAIKLDKTAASPHHHLGIELMRQRDLAGARAAFRKASDLDPGFAVAHYNLGIVLLDTRHPAGAEKAFRKAIAADPRDGEFHGALAEALQAQGRFAEARRAAVRGLDLLKDGHPKRAPVAGVHDRCDLLAALEPKLPAFLRGEVLPRNDRERIALAELCHEHKQLYCAAVRFYAAAFNANPKLANTLRPPLRYTAACAAVLAAAGRGKDAGKLDDKERAGLRRQALEWLRADLAVLADGVENAPRQASPVVRGFLSHWQKSPLLDSVRLEEALAKLPEAERKDWQKLWADVEALRKKADKRAGQK